MFLERGVIRFWQESRLIPAGRRATVDLLGAIWREMPREVLQNLPGPSARDITSHGTRSGYPATYYFSQASFPGSAWERHASQAPPAPRKLRGRSRACSPFPGRAWERGDEAIDRSNPNLLRKLRIPSFARSLVPRLRLGTPCLAGSACPKKTPRQEPRVQCVPRQSLGTRRRGD